MDNSDDSDSSNTSWVFVHGTENKETKADKKQDEVQQLPEQVLESAKSEVDSESDEISVISECEDGNYDILHEVENDQREEIKEAIELSNKKIGLKKPVVTSNYVLAIGFVLFAVLGAFYYNNESETDVLDDQSDLQCSLKNKTLCELKKVENSERQDYKKQNSSRDIKQIEVKNGADAGNKGKSGEIPGKKAFLVDECYMNFQKKAKKTKETLDEYVGKHKKRVPKFQGDTRTNNIMKETEFPKKRPHLRKLDDLTVEEKEKHLQLQEEYLKKKEKFLIRKEYQLIQKEIELERIIEEAKTNEKEATLKKQRKTKYEKQNQTPNYYKKKIIIGKDRNRTLSGDWYNILYEERNKQRRFKHESDWYFDRANYRDKKRNKAHWYFKWMNEREHLRVKKVQNSHAF